jgi:hypothetical protein
MKAITVHQPWATFLAYGVKRYETRGWSTNYRGPIAIHAGRSMEGLELLMDDEVESFVQKLELTKAVWTLGAVVAVGELTHIYRSEDMRDHLTPLELALGNYDDGRFGWEISNVQLLPAPVFVAGKQGLWEWAQP